MEQIVTFVIIPFLIFLSRIGDVTIGTLRIMFVSKGIKYLAPILGFFEVIIWLLAMRAIMDNVDNIITFISYAGGFAVGNYIGIMLEQKLSIGLVAIRVITKKDCTELLNYMRKRNYGVTIADAEGSDGKVKILYSIVKRRNLRDALDIITKFNPKAFYSVEDIQHVNEGIFPLIRPKRKNLIKMFPPFRKSK
jgi:uncharacterized protein YebE (UPF0316 family)